MRNPKVSIIIAAYNAGPTIEKALCSVEKQSFQDWECLIIDGMSHDDTIQKVKYFADKDNRFRVFSEPDKGVFDAFNKGWQKAQGEWIYYLGSDDELLPDGIKSLMEYADGVDLVYGGIRMKYRSKCTKDKEASFWEKEMPFSLPASHQAIIMKRDAIERLGGYDLKYKILADYDLINHAFFVGMKANRCSDMIAVFSLGGLSTDNIASLAERYQILVKYGVSRPRAFIHRIKMTVFFLILKVKHYFD